MKEDIRNVPGNTLSMIADSVAELLDTGIYTDRTGLAHENHSPEDSGGLRFRDGDPGLEEYVTRMKTEAMQSNHGEVFYQNEQGSTNLAVIPDEIFDKIGVDPIPFKLTKTMAYLYQPCKRTWFEKS